MRKSLAQTVLHYPIPLTMKAGSTNETCMHSHKYTDMQAGGQNKVLMPEEKIRMTKENGTESGELQGGGQQRWGP